MFLLNDYRDIPTADTPYSSAMLKRKLISFNDIINNLNHNNKLYNNINYY